MKNCVSLIMFGVALNCFACGGGSSDVNDPMDVAGSGGSAGGAVAVGGSNVIASAGSGIVSGGSAGSIDVASGGTGPSCNAVLNGTWGDNDPNALDVIAFRDGGVFNYSNPDQTCAGIGTYSCPNDSNTVQVNIDNVQASTGKNCLKAGMSTCTFSVSGTAMTYNCGSGAMQFFKIN